ncbi:MAG TPA: protein kinase [Gemmatimonadaceae bacterium]|jgi:serine/threonine protein kinase/alpha-tubulin suppressor-like RCC1 family protein
MSSEQSPLLHAAIDADYEIIRELGRGGTALVYLARERATGDEVAIKLIRSRYIDDDEAQARFAREARLVARLHHPSIVPVRAVLDLGTSGLAIVMDHVVGHTLKQRIKNEGWLASEDVAQILREIGGALAEAHANGVIHRDVKPENIFIDGDGRAMLADFGLARSMTPDSALTMAGVALGTPAYMAPEQIDGNDLDARVDVYSLGLVAWEMLTGRRAWLGEGLYDILYHQKHELPPDVRELRDDVPDRLAEVIARSIEKKRDARWRSMRDMLDALDESTPLVVSRGRVSHGDETIRFSRSSLPIAAPAIVALTAFEEEVPAIEMRPRRLPVVINKSTVAATLSVAALAFAFVRFRPEPAAAAPDHTIQPILQGDARKSVTLPATAIDSQIARPTANRPAAIVAAPITPATKLAPADSVPPQQAPVVIPTLKVPTRIAVAAVVADKNGRSDSSVNSIWGGPPPLKPTTTIMTGGTHSCLVSAIGKATCWGANDHGQLGDASADRTKSLVNVDIQPQLVAITAGTSHTCAIERDGVAVCWGNNDHGQSGGKSFASKMAPSGLTGSHVFWAIAAGDTHTCAVDEYGAPWCWGSNARGQLGEPSVTESATPILSGNGAIHFMSITAGSNFTCGLSANGHASCWGENRGGQLGDGSTFDRTSPVAVASGSFTSIAAGSNHVCGLTSDGEAYCWGRNTFGQLGDGGTIDRNTPVRVRGGTRFSSISAGTNHTCAVAVDGTGYCWGQNTFGQLGNGAAADVAQPSTVADGHSFTTVHASGSHTCGLTVRGEAFCWGNNSENQLGDGTQTHRAHPTLVGMGRDR